MRYFATNILLLISVFAASGQVGRFYSPDDDLSNSLVNYVYQDKKGFVWIATEDGLNRFDGTKFTIYRHSPDDGSSIASNYVKSIFEDSAGNFWVGSMSGLALYDRGTGDFRVIEMRREGKVVAPHVVCIVESRDDGRILLATSGMGLFEVIDGVAVSILDAELTSGYLSWIHEDLSGRLWIGTENNGVNMLDPSTGLVRSYEAPADISGNHISSIVEDHDGNIFVGTLTRGFNIYDATADRFRPIPYKGGRQLFVKSLYVNRKNILLIGTDGQGLKEYNPATGRVEDRQITSAPFDFSKAKVHSIVEDKDDNLWLGIFQKGVVLIPATEKKFDYWGFKSLTTNPIGSNAVMSICRDRDGVVWIGTDGDGLYGVDGNGTKVAHFVQTDLQGSISNVVNAIFEDSRGDLWVGSYMGGLARIDRRTGRCSYVEGLADEKVYTIDEDGQGNLLVGTYGSGFYTMSLSDHSLMRYESTKREDGNFGEDAVTNDWISDILVDSDGMVWLAHFNGVSPWDPERGTFLNYLNQNTILPGVVVYDLCEDRQGRIWVGATNGVWVFDKRDSSILHYTTADGLPTDVVCAIEEDAQGNMWMSTYMGIGKLDIAQNRFVNYYAGDGLQGNEFTRGASFVAPDGKMYFGGIYGVTLFHPKEITNNNKELRVLITDFYIGSQAVPSVMETDHFQLAARDNTFSIDFSALEYANPERIVYQYKIAELGPEWINSYRGVNRATWTNMAPGTYTFSVRAQDNENFSEPRTIRVVIAPPWWLSWWAYMAYVALGLLAVWFVAMWIRGRIESRQTELRRRHAEQINEAKLQFFINISHEIRTPMTLIINPLEKLISDNRDGTLQKTYVMIHRNAQRILRLINQLMDVRKLDKGQMRLHCRQTDIVGFIEDVMHTFEYVTQKKNIAFNFVHDDERLMVWIDLNNFDKVLMNILSNAFKYTPDNGNITIELTHDENEFQITVTDSGIGINEGEIENIFERFYQIHNDVTDANFGTGIGMHLTRSLVELHHGTITAANREESSGARFTVRMPLGNAHLSNTEMYTDSLPPTPFVAPTIMQGDEKPKPKTAYRVLVAEDESELRDYIRSELEPMFRVSEAANGKEALQMILTDEPDLVISDVMMPEMDGVTLVRKMKHNVNINHIPVVLLTAKATPENRIEGLDVGADGYITKPFNTEVLRSTVMNLIENRKRLRDSFSGAQLPEEMLRKIELKSADEQLMVRVMNFINDNLSNSDLSVEELAVGVGMSRVHLHRKLKDLTGQSAGDFLKGIRLKQAATLLEQGKFTVSEVAYATGFSNLSHFSNSFKEFYGMSPTAYVNKPS